MPKVERKIDLNTLVVIAGLLVSFIGSTYARDFRISAMENNQAAFQTSIQALTTEMSALKVEIASLRAFYQGREGLPTR